MLSFKVHSNAWKRIFIQVSLWKESLMYTEGKGRKHNDIFVLSQILQKAFFR